MDDLSWLDSVPGGRDAYNFVIGKVADFQLLGTRELPAWNDLLAVVGPRIRASNNGTLNSDLQSIQSRVGTLQRAWDALNSKLGAAMAQLRNAGLGNPLWIALAALTAVAGGMTLLFWNAENTRGELNAFVDRNVAAGTMSVSEGARWKAGGGMGASLESFGTKLVLLAAIGAAVYFIPRRRSA